MKTMSQCTLSEKRVLVRLDLNTPMNENGEVQNDARLRAAVPTIKALIESNAKIMLMSHLGRPTEGQFEDKFSLAPIAKRLSELLETPVKFIGEMFEPFALNAGEVALFENVRFLKGEKKCDELLSKQMADLCDVFVMDAFGSAHRAHASTYGVAKFAPEACAGPLLDAELTAIGKGLESPQSPVVAIVGGAKVSTKLQVLENLIDKVECLVLGGGIVNTFLKATGKPVGKSLYEPDLVDTAKAILEKAKASNVSIPLPEDVVVATEFSKEAKATVKSVEAVSDDDMILDIGPKASDALANVLLEAKTILWNGPVGVFEFAAFAAGTQCIAEAVAKSEAYSIAGGGDTIAAIEAFNIAEDVSVISTGGGAFLELLEGKTLPGVAILQTNQKTT